jgi:Flp pilus assembly protein TadG
MPKLRDRRGATLVLVAILMTVLIGFTGIAIDASRLYVMRAQLQTTADASAIAGIVEVKNKRPTQATALALQYVPQNLVERQVPTVNAADVEPGSWNFTTNTFTPLASWTDPALGAVRVTARYPSAYTFARVFGVTGKLVQARAVAAIGYVGTTDCLRPWAVSYQTLLNVLYPPAGTKNPSYNLTAQDIQTLTGMSYPANSIALLQGTSDPLTPGNIAQVVVNDPWNGNNAYKDAIQGCSNMDIGPGAWIDGDPGNGGGQTASALRTFCQNNGGISGGGQTFTCVAQPKIKLVMWDQYNGAPGSNLRVRVKYVGVFALAGFNGGANSSQVKGFFTSMATTGGFSANPSPVTGSIALVQ